jgi:hypothetical protein
MAERELPEILAGPIVRRVEPRACSVWIALRDPSDAVKLTVWRGLQVAGVAGGQVASGNAPAGSATVATRQFGRKLHIALVTVSFAAPLPPLEPGAVYAYDLQVGTRGLKQLGLLQDDPASQALALGYETDRLPSFVTPPARAGDTCFCHTSCRRAGAPDHDALRGLDVLIHDSLNTPAERPQQLYLTGDQIYADDLPSRLLEMLSPIAHDVVGADEKVGDAFCTLDNYPPDDLTNPPLEVKDVPRVLVKRGRRLTVQQFAGFTTTDSNHLMSYGEYVAMYLAVWNPRIWFVPAQGPLTPRLLLARAGVPAVARALANVATYMIFDDHDVTDDWNLSQKWMNRVYTKPMGAQIVRNALCAYALFQGWGNDPAAFASGRNAELLVQIAARFGQAAGPYPKGDDNPMHQLIGLITATPAQQVSWNYRVPAPTTMTIVLDTRTRRKFAGQGYQPPDLLGQNRDAQLPAGPLTDGREMLFVVSAAPVIGPDVIDSIGWPAAQIAIDAAHLGKGLDEAAVAFPEIGGKYVREPRPNIGTEKYDAEGWSANEPAREEFLRRLAAYPAAAILSGDVHFSCSVVMDHYRKGVALPSRIVQLTCSPAHNRFKPVVRLMVRQNPVLQQVAGAIAISRMAWADKSPLVVPSPSIVSPGRRGRMARKPSLIPAAGWPAGTAFPADKPPDWRWRLQVLRDNRPEGELPPNLRQPLFTSAQELKPADALPAYQAIAGRHQAATSTRFEHLRQIVFNSNIGVVRLRREASTGPLTLRHSLYSCNGPGSPEMTEGTRHETSLAPSVLPAPEIEFR